MKACLIVLAAVVAVVLAEAPAPYPPAGYRPAKAFLLPLKFRQRYETYGPPNPSPSYGPPPQPTEAPAEPEEEPTEAAPEEEPEAPEAPEEAAPEEETTDAPAEEDEQSTEPPTEEGRASEDNEVAQPTGLYYVLLPDGRLQRVIYSTGAPELGYTAQLRIANVDPIPPAPVYAYGGPLTRILRSAN
ncbi:Hypothetical predicted protein [Cloeon dipterum]|uniref:DUF4794 domain-containing protein n=1 Tax=Cloeon dipterum TaxID=197152 RepID=A0A8S1DMI2_9INSE|nr:Hypothetical predicted protein [Cloeon dipterum]